MKQLKEIVKGILQVTGGVLLFVGLLSAALLGAGAVIGLLAFIIS